MLDIKSTWRVEGDVLIIEARAEGGDREYVIQGKTLSHQDPMRECQIMRVAMESAADMYAQPPPGEIWHPDGSVTITFGSDDAA